MNGLQIAILVYIVGMMAANFIILYYLLRNPIVSKRAILFVSSILLYMAVEAADIGYILFYNGSILIEPITLTLASIPILLSITIKDAKVSWRQDKLSALTLSATIILDELAMGYAYSAAFGPHINPILASVSNIAFGVMMLADAIFFLFISPVKKIEEIALFTFATSMAFMPNIFIQFSDYAELYASILASIIMVINVITLYLIQSRKITLNAQLMSLSLGLFDFLIMLGLSVYAVSKDLFFISISMIISMFWYFILILYNFSDKKIRITLKYPLTFVILINLAELTMGFGETVLGFKVTNGLWTMSSMTSVMHGHDHHLMMPMNTVHTSDHGMHMMMWSPMSNPFWWIFPFDPWSMTTMAFNEAIMATGNSLFSIFWASYMLIMMTTMAPFYVIMMGAEMSYLVYERFRSAKSLSVKAWSLGILAGVPLFVVLLPYYTPAYIFGMSGMLAHINPEFMITLVSFSLSIIAIIIASTLFGRRAYCNLVCMAAHMWTNVYYDQFKPKKSAKIWEYLRWVFLGIMVLAFTYVILIFLGVAKNPTIGSLEIPLLNFYGMFTLNYIWWFFFFLTPVFGAYSCARQGWCGFGTFTGLFNKVIFKVKAKSVKTCEDCKEISCEKSCPTKISIRTDILQKGYVNRVSCIGCGDCVESCPYDNLYIVDITNYFRKSAKAETS